LEFAMADVASSAGPRVRQRAAFAVPTGVEFDRSGATYGPTGILAARRGISFEGNEFAAASDQVQHLIDVRAEVAEGQRRGRIRFWFKSA
jgi:hypothetical protein